MRTSSTSETHGSDESDIEEDILLQYGYIFALTRIGEYVKRLSYEFIEEHREVDWKGSVLEISLCTIMRALIFTG